MQKNQKYFDDARLDAESRFFSADGFDENDFMAEGDEEFNVEAVAQAKPTSLPYIISVYNSSTDTAMSNVVILDAVNKLRNIANTAAYGNNAAITISSGVAGTTYNEILWTAMNRPFVVGLTYLSGTAQADVLATLSVQDSKADGSSRTYPLIPTIDPYQNQTTMAVFKNVFRVDGFTKITISSVAATHTLLIYLYRSEDSDISRTLAGQAITAGRTSPNVVKQARVQLNAPGKNSFMGY